MATTKRTTKKSKRPVDPQWAAWLQSWYGASAGGSVLRDYAEGNVRTIHVEESKEEK